MWTHLGLLLGLCSVGPMAALRLQAPSTPARHGPPCECEASNAAWRPPNRSKPECLFIDLGAADGESWKVFAGKSEKHKFDFDTKGYRKEDCYAYLVEANTQFVKTLEDIRTDHVFPMTGVAAYMCDKDAAPFYIDIHGPNSWGSSLNATHQSVKQTNEMKTDVRLYNLNRLLVENTIPADTVVVKMDIEGAEWDILPCLASSPAAKLVDTLYFEDHCPGQEWCPTSGQAGNSRTVLDAAKAKLVTAGIRLDDRYTKW